MPPRSVHTASGAWNAGRRHTRKEGNGLGTGINEAQDLSPRNANRAQGENRYYSEANTEVRLEDPLAAGEGGYSHPCAHCWQYPQEGRVNTTIQGTEIEAPLHYPGNQNRQRGDLHQLLYRDE